MDHYKGSGKTSSKSEIKGGSHLGLDHNSARSPSLTWHLLKVSLKTLEQGISTKFKVS